MEDLIGQGSSKKWKCLWTDYHFLKSDEITLSKVLCTRNMEVPTDVIAKIDEHKVTCPRCRLKLRLLQEFLKRKPDTFKKGEQGICDHCLAKQVQHDPSCTCNKTLKQFIKEFDKYSRQPEAYFDRVQSFAPKSFLPKEMRGVPVTEKTKPPFMLRRWHSEASMMGSISNIRERDFKKNLNFFFPQLAQEAGTIGERRSSGEIIKQTADRLKVADLRKLGLSESDEHLYDYVIDPSTGKAFLKLKPAIINDDTFDYFIDPSSGQTFRKFKEKRRYRDDRREPFEDDLHYDYITDPITGKRVKRLRQRMLPTDEDMYEYVTDPYTGKTVKKLKRPALPSGRDIYEYITDPFTGRKVRKRKEGIYPADDDMYEYVTDEEFQRRMSPSEDEYVYESVTDPFTGKTVRKLRKRISSLEDDIYEYVTDPYTGKIVKIPKKRISSADEDMYEYVTDPFTGKMVKKLKRRMLPSGQDIFEYVTDPFTGKTVRKLKKRISSSEEDSYEYLTDPYTGKIVKIPKKRISSADEDMYEYVTDPFTGKTVRKLKKRLSSLEEDMYEYLTDPNTGKIVKIPKTRISAEDEDMYEYVTDPFTGKMVRKLQRRMLPPGEDMYEYVTDPFTGKMVRKLQRRMLSPGEDMYEYVTDPFTGKMVRKLQRRTLPPGEDMYEYVTDPFTGQMVRKLQRRMLPPGEDSFDYVTDPFTGKMVRKLQRRMLPPGEDSFDYVTDPYTGKMVRKLQRRMLPPGEDSFEYVTDPFTGKKFRKLKKRLSSFEEEEEDDAVYEYITDPSTGKIIKRLVKTVLPGDSFEYVTDPFTGKTVKKLKTPLPTGEDMYEYFTEPLTGKTVKKLKKQILPSGKDMYEYVTDPYTGKTIKRFKARAQPSDEDIYEYVTDPYSGKTVKKKKKQVLPLDEDVEYFTDPFTGKVYQKVKMRISPTDENMYEYIIDPFTGERVEQLKKGRKSKRMPSADEDVYEYLIDPMTGKRVDQDEYEKMLRRNKKDVSEYVTDPIARKIMLKKIKMGQKPGKKGGFADDHDDRHAGRKPKKIQTTGKDVDADIYVKIDQRKLQNRSEILRTLGKKPPRAIIRNIFESDSDQLRESKVKKSRALLSAADVLPDYLKMDFTPRKTLKASKSLPSEVHIKRKHDLKSKIVPLPKYIRDIQAANKKKLKASKSLPSELHIKKDDKSTIFDPTKRQPRPRSSEDKKKLNAVYSQLMKPLVDSETTMKKKKKRDDGGNVYELKKKRKSSEIYKPGKDKPGGEKKKDKTKKESGPETGEAIKTTDELPEGDEFKAQEPQELIIKLMEEQGPREHGTSEKLDYQLPDLPHLRKRKQRKSDTDLSRNTSDLEIDKDEANYVFEDINVAIEGTKITKKKDYKEQPSPMLLFDDEELMRFKESEGLKPPKADPSLDDEKKKEEPKMVFKYALSDRQFIENGYTKLPTTKTFRKMNLYRMRPAQPELDWFERNKEKSHLKYDTGETLAQIDEKGHGRWFYKNGKVALEYYKTKDKHAQHRFVIRSSGHPNEHGRSQPVTVLGIFDHFGGGVIFDHGGKIRIKYNQSEGVVLDRKIGPVSHWQWHSLNQPPNLQQVIVNETLPNKDENISSLGKKYELPTRKRKDEEMLTIEYENYIKENTFAQKPYKPFKISSKTVKINKQFTLKILDQSKIHLTFRDGTANMKINLGMLLDPKELMDTEIVEVGNIPNETIEAIGARTRSMEQLILDLKLSRHDEAKRLEREIRLRKPISELTIDLRTAPLSHPLRPTTNNPSQYNYNNRKNFCQNNKYYSTSIFN